MRLLKNWDKEEKASAIRILGLITGALTIFILMACVSYLFRWKQDMSLLGDTEAMQAARKAAGSLGIRTGHLLISELFGLGSFCLLLILGAVTVRLLLHRWRRSLVKTALIAMFGAFISSFLFAWCGQLAGLDGVFGGGLGGRCGALVVGWAENLFGTIVTGCFIIILIAAFLFFSPCVQSGLPQDQLRILRVRLKGNELFSRLGVLYPGLEGMALSPFETKSYALCVTALIEKYSVPETDPSRFLPA